MSCDTLALRRLCACLPVLLTVIVGSSNVMADDGRPDGIRSGLVVIDGKLLDRPYVVSSSGLDVTVNGKVVGQVSNTAASAFPFEDSPANAAIARVERLLMHDGLLLRQNETALLLSGMCGNDGGTVLMSVLEAVSSDRPPSEILYSLTWIDDPAVQHMTSQRWLEIISLFRTNKALRREIADYCGVGIDPVIGDLDAESDGELVEHATKPGDIAEPVQYAVNLFGMLAGVAALGSLLTARPNTERRWRDTDASAAGLKLVTRCGGLILLLGLFDLACTLMAFHTGMFRELNPVAAQLSSSPLLIIGFKVAAMLTGVGLLWRLRQYAGAQTAAWWMCLVCTLVVFRWLTYHSMFIA
ncbi:hypothetical protein GC176_04445 [bacterium]|nr:hypothetical protein [bacterium]